MQQASRHARLERTKARTTAIIAAAVERALVEVGAAAEKLSKGEERNAERQRRLRERNDRERGEKRGGEGNREMRLLKLVGAVAVRTVSKYQMRMEVDTFKKHAKEVRGLSLPPGCFR